MKRSHWRATHITTSFYSSSIAGICGTTSATSCISSLVTFCGNDCIAGDAKISSYVAGRLVWSYWSLERLKTTMLEIFSRWSVRIDLSEWWGCTYSWMTSSCNSGESCSSGWGFHVFSSWMNASVGSPWNGFLLEAISTYEQSMKRIANFLVLLTMDIPNAHISDRTP